jgi:hypothetical protein
MCILVRRRPSARLAESTIIDAMFRLATLPCAFVLALSALWQPQSVYAADSPPLCIYKGNSFSEGANICGQASLVLACTVVGDRAVWKVVTDREISRLCVTPSRVEEPNYRPHRRIARHMPSSNIAPAIGQPAAGSAKCFMFNGKRFCE